MPTVANQNTVIGRDVTVFGIQNIPGGNGTLGTATSFLASFKKADFSIKRKFEDVTGANDTAVTERPVMFDKGQVTLSGFVRGVSGYAALFAQGAFCQVNFTEQTLGDAYQLLCCVVEYKKSSSGAAHEDSLTLDVIGVPQYGPGGVSAGTPAAITLQ